MNIGGRGPGPHYSRCPPVAGPDYRATLARVLPGAFTQRHDLLQAWLPVVTSFVLPDATHLLHVQNPGGMATRLARFLADVAQAPPSGEPCHQPPPRTAMRNL